MATLVLTAVGTAIGGPIGGMIGSMVGQHIDRTILFPPKARHGPRLGDLAVQTSSYGTAIPKVFGRMRVAGCVVWATDLVETRSTTGGGKGQPKLVSYNYSANFAVALSGRPIRSVGRIWADGKLLRGAAGDFKAQTDFRLYTGGEDQQVDPLIASAEGIDRAPAFRGTAYAVFEQLQLEDYGNRIPSLTFEVVADEEDIALGAIAAELSSGEIAAGEGPVLVGYAASGDSVRSAVEALGEVVPLSLGDADGSLRLHVAAAGPVRAIAAAQLSRAPDITRRGSSNVPDQVTLAYYDPARDFQAGLQRAASFAADSSRQTDRRIAAAALEAEAAKALAEFRLSSLRAGRTNAKLQAGAAQLDLRPGGAVSIDGEQGAWRVHRWSWTEAGLSLELGLLPVAGLPPLAGAEPGRNVSETDLPHGPTLLRLAELPLGDDGSRPVILVAAAGASAGWRRARLLTSVDDGASWQEAGPTAPPAVLGAALGVLPPGPATLIDARHAIEVELQHEGMWLHNASDAALADGANLALIGDELVQFGRAEWLGGRRFQLSRLLRGRRGTEWAAGLHQADESFLLVERGALAAVELPPGSIGAKLKASASGIGDGASPAVATLVVAGEALRPPAPVHLRARRLPNGDVDIGWVRRSRLGWSWTSGSGTPLGEEFETYQLTVRTAASERRLELAAAHYSYTAAEQAADGAAGALTIEVTQAGTHAVSRPSILILE